MNHIRSGIMAKRMNGSDFELMSLSFCFKFLLLSFHLEETRSWCQVPFEGYSGNISHVSKQ